MLKKGASKLCGYSMFSIRNRIHRIPNLFYHKRSLFSSISQGNFRHHEDAVLLAISSIKDPCSLKTLKSINGVMRVNVRSPLANGSKPVISVVLDLLIPGHPGTDQVSSCVYFQFSADYVCTYLRLSKAVKI
jgi:hypothetical protein